MNGKNVDVITTRTLKTDIYRNTLDDGRNRAAFILFKHFQKESGSEKAGKMLIEWYQNQKQYTKTYTTLTMDNINYIIKYHTNKKYQPPGCNYIRDYMISIGKKKVCDSCPCNGSDNNGSRDT